MKVLIQHVQSGHYLSPNGSWTASASTAKDFRYTSYAHSVMKRQQSRGLRVLFYFEELDYSVTVRSGLAERLCPNPVRESVEV